MSQGLLLNTRFSSTANRFIFLFIGVFLVFGLTGGNVLGQSNLEYQKRVNRYEGLKDRPVSGFDIELLSAHVDYHEDTSVIGEFYQVRFFLDQTQPVHLLAREIDYKHFYWLDRVEPPAPWQKGFANVFAWPTADVIQQLKGLSLYNLGVVARLGNAGPRADERVAPVLMYQNQQPSKIDGYVFVFRLRDEAKIKGTIYKATGGKPIVEQDLGWQSGGRPFEIRWNLSRSPAVAGAYKLVLSGYLSNNDPVGHVVHFYHQPVIK